MAAPQRDDRKTYLGDDGVPTNDTDPYGGAIDTGTPVNPATLGSIFGSLKLTTSDINYYSIFYVRMEQGSPGTLDNARWNNRAGARLNTSSGLASVISTNANDTGDIVITGKVSGVWTQETLTLNGTTLVSGATVWDTNSAIRWESLDGEPLGLVTCAVNSSTCAVIYGTDGDPNDGFPSIATYMASAELEFALADTINTTISGTDRLTAPSSGIGSFSKATKWSGEDFSINVPGGELGPNDYVGVCVKFIANANVPAPNNNKMQFMGNMLGDALGT